MNPSPGSSRGGWCVLLAMLSVCYAFTVPRDTSRIPIWKGPAGVVREIEFSPDDRHFAVVTSYSEQLDASDEPVTPLIRNTRTISVVNTRTGKTLWSVKVLGLRLLCFSPDSNRLAFFDAMVGCQVYDIRAQRCLLQLKHQQVSQNGERLGFSADGNFLILGPHPVHQLYHRTVHMSAWDLRTGAEVTTIPRATWWKGYGLSRDGSKWTSRRVVFDLKSLKNVAYCYRHSMEVFFDFTRDCQHVFSIYEDGAIILWQFNDKERGGVKELKLELNSGLEKFRCLALLNASDRLAYVDAAGTIFVQNLFRN